MGFAARNGIKLLKCNTMSMHRLGMACSNLAKLRTSDLFLGLENVMFPHDLSVIDNPIRVPQREISILPTRLLKV